MTPISPLINECSENLNTSGEVGGSSEGDEDAGTETQQSMEEDEPHGQSSVGQGSQGEHVEHANAMASEGTDEDGGEADRPRPLKAPYKPSAREIAEHELTHCPPRSWCDHCVKGQYKDRPHRSVSEMYADSDITRVAMDYCYVKEDVKNESDEHTESSKAKTSLTVMVMQESMCSSIWCYAVENKGAGETWLAEQLTEDLETIGLTQERLILKADQEPSVTDVQREMVRRRSGHGTAIEQSHVGSSNTNGRIERAIQDAKGLIRTLRSALEEHVGEKIHLSDPVVPWLVRHAGHVISISRIRPNGRTAYQMMKGRRTNAKLLPFGEVILSTLR